MEKHNNSQLGTILSHDEKIHNKIKTAFKKTIGKGVPTH